MTHEELKAEVKRLTQECELLFSGLEDLMGYVEQNEEAQEASLKEAYDEGYAQGEEDSKHD